jgi:hypothetical protein
LKKISQGKLESKHAIHLRQTSFNQIKSHISRTTKLKIITNLQTLKTIIPIIWLSLINIGQSKLEDSVQHAYNPGLARKYQWQEFPVVITGKYRSGKYSKFELKREILGNMIFRCD